MILQLPSITPRQALILVHDLIMTAVAIVAAFFLRFETFGLMERLDGLLLFVPGFLVYAAVIYRLFHLYQSKWRFASLPEAANILAASTVLALTLVVVDYVLVAPNVLGAFFFGKLTIVLYWLLQVALLGGPRRTSRCGRRFRHRSSPHHP